MLVYTPMPYPLQQSTKASNNDLNPNSKSVQFRVSKIWQVLWDLQLTFEVLRFGYTCSFRGSKKKATTQMKNSACKVLYETFAIMFLQQSWNSAWIFFAKMFCNNIGRQATTTSIPNSQTSPADIMCTLITKLKCTHDSWKKKTRNLHLDRSWTTLGVSDWKGWRYSLSPRRWELLFSLQGMLCTVFGLQKWIRFEPSCSTTTMISVLYIEAMCTRALKSSMGVERKAIWSARDKWKTLSGLLAWMIWSCSDGNTAWSCPVQI